MIYRRNSQTTLRLLWVVVIVSICCSVAGGQSAQADTMILANVNVYLGMTKAMFLQKLNKPYSLTNIGDDQYQVLEQNNYLSSSRNSGTVRNVGTVKFVNGRLSFASKSWTQDGATASEVAVALFAILSYTEKEGWRISRYSTDTLHQPGIELQVVTIFVGSRRITIIKSNGRVSNQDVSGVSVEEGIGAKN
jgi:hypothetical protein